MRAKRKKDIADYQATMTNVWVRYDPNQVVLGCVWNGARYHVWLDRRTLQMKEMVLYKNPNPLGAGKTRELNASVQTNADLIAAMRKEAERLNLFTAAYFEAEAGEAKERQNEEETRRKHRLMEAAPELGKALKELFVHYAAGSDYSGPLWTQAQKALIQAGLL